MSGCNANHREKHENTSRKTEHEEKQRNRKTDRKKTKKHIGFHKKNEENKAIHPKKEQRVPSQYILGLYSSMHASSKSNPMRPFSPRFPVQPPCLLNKTILFCDCFIFHICFWVKPSCCGTSILPAYFNGCSSLIYI